MLKQLVDVPQDASSSFVGASYLRPNKGYSNHINTALTQYTNTQANIQH